MRTFSLDECWNGIHKTIDNAKRLREDAEHNITSKRSQAAALLGCFSFDEFGKAFVLAKLVIEAAEAGRNHVTLQKLKARGFFNHAAKLSFLFKIATPVFAAFPSGPETYVLANRVKDAVLKLRSAVAYVNVDEQSFTGPDAIDVEQCELAIHQLSHLQTFVDDRVLPFWEQRFSAAQIQKVDPNPSQAGGSTTNGTGLYAKDILS